MINIICCNQLNMLTLTWYFKEKTSRYNTEHKQSSLYSSRYQATRSYSHPAHSYSQVLAHSNSAGHSSSITSVKTNGGPDISIPIQSIPTFEKSSVSNAVISVLIATVKNCEEPGTFETVLNCLLTANGFPTFKMGNVTPPTSFPLTPTDTTCLNTQSTFTPSSPDKPSTASPEDHSASKATIFKKKTNQTTNKRKYIRTTQWKQANPQAPLKIDKVIEHLTSNKNNIEVVHLSSSDFGAKAPKMAVEFNNNNVDNSDYFTTSTFNNFV